MAEEKQEKREKKKVVRRALRPYKRTINLAEAEKKKLNMRLLVPLFLGVIIVSALFGKFGIADQFRNVRRAEREVAELTEELNRNREALNSMSEVRVRYAHYSYSGMSDEEMNRADRAQVLDLMEHVLLPRVPSNTWQLTGNVLTLSISGHTLQEINIVAQRLLTEPLVDYCTVTAASYTGGSQRNEHPSENEIVTANLVIYLNSGRKGAR